MTTELRDRNATQETEWHLPRTRGVFVKLYPDTKLAEEWYEGEFSIR